MSDPDDKGERIRQTRRVSSVQTALQYSIAFGISVSERALQQASEHLKKEGDSNALVYRRLFSAAHD